MNIIRYRKEQATQLVGRLLKGRRLGADHRLARATMTHIAEAVLLAKPAGEPLTPWLDVASERAAEWLNEFTS